jgi:segregation and condensation protein B
VRSATSIRIEALLMVADQPMSAIDLATFLEVPVELVNNLLEKLSAEYRVQGRGFDLRNIADGWRFYSAAECADVVSRFATDGRSAKISQASLETLAVVAYKQPVSRARISAIRGVSVDGVMRTLINRGLVVEVETEPVSGAGLYGTTVYFLERMGMKSLDELPPIEDHLPDLAVLDELIEQAE